MFRIFSNCSSPITENIVNGFSSYVFLKSGYVNRLGPVDNYQCLQRLVGKLMSKTLTDVFDAQTILSRLKNKHNH